MERDCSEGAWGTESGETIKRGAAFLSERSVPRRAAVTVGSRRMLPLLLAALCLGGAVWAAEPVPRLERAIIETADIEKVIRDERMLSASRTR
jgi:hypothetical protein